MCGTNLSKMMPFRDAKFMEFTRLHKLDRSQLASQLPEAGDGSDDRQVFMKKLAFSNLNKQIAQLLSEIVVRIHILYIKTKRGIGEITPTRFT